MKRVLISIAVVVALGAVVLVSIRSGGRQKATRVYAEEAAERDITRLVKASGQIDPRVKVNISAHVIGKIEKLFVEEGDWIEAGKPFLVLETEAFLAARDQAKAQVAIAESRVRQAQIRVEDAALKLRRMQRLYDEQVVSIEQLEQAQVTARSADLDLEEAREAVLQARAGLNKAEDDLSKATIYAPLTGRVIALNAEQGEVVVSGTMNNPASVIGTIADLSEILAEVDVDETEVAYLAPDQQTRLVVDAFPDREYSGRVVEVGSSGFERQQQPDVTFFKVKVLLDDPDPELRPGMSARAEINTAERKGVVVAPIQAVVDRPPLEREESSEEPATVIASDPQEIKVVFVIGDDDLVRQQPVETGISDATHVEILSGLEAGQRVVTGPYRSIRDLEDGDLVKVRSQGDDEDEDG